MYDKEIVQKRLVEKLRKGPVCAFFGEPNPSEGILKLIDLVNVYFQKPLFIFRNKQESDLFGISSLM